MTAPLVSVADIGSPNAQPQATVKVAPCLGCGGLPHGSVNALVKCLAEALIAARSVGYLDPVERAELRALRERCDRQERQLAEFSLKSRGVPRS